MQGPTAARMPASLAPRRFHGGKRGLQHAADGAAPAGMRGGDHAGLGVGEQHGRAVGRQHAEGQAAAWP